MTVAIVTDSTADLPADLAAQKGIRVIPLNVHFGTEVFRDGVDLDADAFYEMLTGGDVFPTTSQPSVGAFVDVYRELSETCDAIISVHISSKISGTCNSAIQAKEAIGDGTCRIEIIDTLQASMSLGLIALGAADAVRAGAGVDEALETADRLTRSARLFGVIDTLEYLHKGGRIGRAQMLLGSVLKMKPVLSLVDGVATPVERTRTLARGIGRLRTICEEMAPLSALSVLDSTEPEVADRLAADLADFAPGGQVLRARFGPILGTYLGPRAIGIALTSEDPA